MTFLPRLLLMLPVLLLGGCMGPHFPVFISEQPLGEVVALDPEQWNGLWLGAYGEQFRVSIVDAEKGLFVMDLAENCEVQDEDLEAFQFRTVNSPVSSGTWYFTYFIDPDVAGISMCPDEETDIDDDFQRDECTAYVSLASLREANTLLPYFPDEERVIELIERGELPGRVEYETGILGRLEPKHYEVLLGGDRPALQWHEFYNVLVKAPPELDPCNEASQARP